jgi:hypothetical protein
LLERLLPPMDGLAARDPLPAVAREPLLLLDALRVLPLLACPRLPRLEALPLLRLLPEDDFEDAIALLLFWWPRAPSVEPSPTVGRVRIASVGIDAAPL